MKIKYTFTTDLAYIYTMFKPKNILVYLALSACFITLLGSCAITKAWQKNSQRVGELVPCSARVAKKITENIEPENSPKRIIEVGAGSGALTGKIIKKMNESDHLDLIEIEPLLCDELHKKFGQLKNVAIHCMDFLDWQPDYEYDYVVSTLPFNSFPPELTQKLIDHLVHVSKNGAYLGFVEYKWLSSLKRLGLNKSEIEGYQKNRDIIEGFYQKYRFYEVDVYINFPPIIVYHLKITK
jgi:phospholipid N-methyltransferase